MSGLDATTDELEYRVTELLEEPWDKEESPPHELSLREALVVTRVYLGQNITEDVRADIFDGSAPGAYLLWAAALLLEAIAHGLAERRAGQGITKATLVGEIAGLLSEVKRSAPTSRGPAWPGERLTDSETRVLRYLPTHLRAAEIAAELHLSANTVKTHLRHLYRKLGAHSRQEAVQRARAGGLLTGSSRRLSCRFR